MFELELCLLAVALPAVLGLVTLIVGFRSGDQSGDAVLAGCRFDHFRGELEVAVANPGDISTLVGISARRPSITLRLTGGRRARVPWSTGRAKLLPSRQMVLGVVAAGQTTTFHLPVGDGGARDVEVIVILGQIARLRVLHRSVTVGSRITLAPTADTISPAARVMDER